MEDVEEIYTWENENIVVLELIYNSLIEWEGQELHCG